MAVGILFIVIFVVVEVLVLDHHFRKKLTEMDEIIHQQELALGSPKEPRV